MFAGHPAAGLAPVVIVAVRVLARMHQTRSRP